MSWDFSTRVASIAITAALAATLTNYDQWVSLVIGFGFAHYLLSFYYARAGIGTLLATRSLYLPLVSLGVLLGVIYFLHFPLEIYFGIHHAFNESYLKRRHEEGQAQLAPTRALFQLAAYFCILRTDARISPLPDTFLWVFLGIASVLYINALRSAYKDSPTGAAQWLRASGIELATLLVIVLSFFVKITFLQIVMYHFVLWTIVPVASIKQQGNHQLAEYALLTAGSLLFFIALIMSQLFSSYMNLNFYYTQFIIWSYIHITTSFALSNAHPQWIVGLFRAPARAR